MRKSERQIYRTRERDREQTMTGLSWIQKTRCKFSPSLGWVRILQRRKRDDSFRMGRDAGRCEGVAHVLHSKDSSVGGVALHRMLTLSASALHGSCAISTNKWPNKREDRRRERYMVRVFMRFKGSRYVWIVRKVGGFNRRRNV